mgnify:CR=1 FL=1
MLYPIILRQIYKNIILEINIPYFFMGKNDKLDKMQ